MRRMIAASALALAPALACGQALTLDQAQKLAVERSFQLRAQDARATASREMARAAGELPDPVLKAGLDNVPADGPDRWSLGRDFMTMRRIGLSQEWTRGEKRELRRERFEREADVANAERDADVAAIRRNTGVAWLACYYDAKIVAAAVRFVRASKDEIEAADAAYRAGRGSQADAIATRSALALAEDRRIDLERRLRSARLELERWTGRHDCEAVSEPPDMSAVHLEHGALEDHLARHPELIALARRADAAQAEARLAAASKKPDWTWEAAYQVRGPAYSNMVSIGVSMPLPWDAANRQDREVAAKSALAQEALARRDEMLRGHIAEVGAMLDEWRAGRERLERFHRDIEPLARDKTVAVLAAFGAGRGGLESVLAARRGEFETNLQALQLDLEVASLWAKLEFLLPDSRGDVR